MIKFSSVILAAITATVAGCAATSDPARIAVLQNPATKQTVECRVDPWGSINRSSQIDNCIAVYIKAGYRLVADSAELGSANSPSK